MFMQFNKLASVNRHAYIYPSMYNQFIRNNSGGKNFKKIASVMSCNRGEIASRVFRAAKDTNRVSVAVYSNEDANLNHRFNADRSYNINEYYARKNGDKKTLSPLEAYLSIGTLVDIAKSNRVDAIHPGYGFLSESVHFAKACEDAGVTFLGPKPEVIKLMGDKVAARNLAISLNIPVIPGTDKPVNSLNEVEQFIKASDISYPIMLKAAHGGGGRGMRIVRSKDELADLFASAKNESEKAFGSGELFVEKYIQRPRHIEVQILGDLHGNILCLGDRDCTVQRRHQKVIEIAPAPNLDEGLRQVIQQHALNICRAAKYSSAGTVEFLIDQDTGKVYFIEVNSRLQVEHTVTEEVFGVDLVAAQIEVAEGKDISKDFVVTQKTIDDMLADPNKIRYSIQSRITTEDSYNNFMPDYGRVSFSSPPFGNGVRVDGSNLHTGNVVTEHYDSLLSKIICSGSTFDEARRRMIRALEEYSVTGVKTNKEFIINVLKNENFASGKYSTDFIEKYKKDLIKDKNLFEKDGKLDEISKTVGYIAETSVNGPFTVLATSLKAKPDTKPELFIDHILNNSYKNNATNTQQNMGLRELMRKDMKAFSKYTIENSKVVPFLTDTTMRDAHQSLLATRMRTVDLLPSARFINNTPMKKLYSLECWGGATYDVAYRFLQECPWERLAKIREAVPGVPLQMLLRGANAVGYTNYADNVVDQFVRLSVQHGMDIFRVFDALNYLPNIVMALESVKKHGGVAEAAVSYTNNHEKYTLDYYIDLFRQLVKSGTTDILAIKDMAGVLTPYWAEKLVKAIRSEFPDYPIHVHTHDTAGTGVATLLAAHKAGANILDVATDSMSGMTSQPSMGALMASYIDQFHGKQLPNNIIDLNVLADYSSYFEQIRQQLYGPFECCVTMKSGNADVYENQIPGGQYTNLQFQAYSLGLGEQFTQVKKAYVQANAALGDLVKVTPTSKVVGDLAQFMVTNGIENNEDLLNRVDQLDLPGSVIEFLTGELGQPYQGYPEPLRSKIINKLGDRVKVYEGRVGDTLPLVNFDELKNVTMKKLFKNMTFSDLDVISYALYPAVFKEYVERRVKYGQIDLLPTDVFFHGLQQNQSVNYFLVDKDGNKFEVVVKMVAMSEPKSDTFERTVVLSVNSQLHTFVVVDQKYKEEQTKVSGGGSGGSTIFKADANNVKHVAAMMPSKVVSIKVKEGDSVKKGQVLVVLSAMKMETNITANSVGDNETWKVKKIHVSESNNVSTGDLLLEFE